VPQTDVRLEVLRQDRPERSVSIKGGAFSIGSDPGADLSLAEPGIATHHAQIVLLGGAHYLVPGSSGSPLSLDEVPVPPAGVPLAHGARIALGPGCPVSLRVVIGGRMPQDQGDRLLAIMEIARTITSSLAVEEVLERVLDGAIRFSGAERGYLFLKDGDGLVPWSRGKVQPPSIEVSRSVAEEVARTGRPVYRDHLGGVDGGSMTASIVRLRLKAILCLPLVVRHEVIGVVYLDSRRPLPHHDPDLPSLEALVGLAAVAFQNSRLVEERLRAERTLALGQMARAIVHDLRAPLGSIRALGELLQERSPEDDPARPHLATIISEVDRLTRLTGDLLQFSADSTPPQLTTVSLADLVRSVLSPLGPGLAKAGVRLDLALDEQARVRMDAQRFLRVLQNLITNAVEAMPGGGILAVACRRDGEAGVISVRDTGHGMTEDVKRRVFDPFFSHGKNNGTGLGMAIVRKIIDEHGATIRIDSAPGKGTLVTVSLQSPAPARLAG
jgi:two-component system, NtrC family, sensor histidine kinase HydH